MINEKNYFHLLFRIFYRNPMVFWTARLLVFIIIISSGCAIGLVGKCWLRSESYLIVYYTPFLLSLQFLCHNGVISVFISLGLL